MIRPDLPSSNGAGLPTLALEDLWDWAYCPMRLWWRRFQVKAADARTAFPTGAELIREATRRSIAVTYAQAKAGEGKWRLHQAFGAVWREWLIGWSIPDGIVDDLLECHAIRIGILARFGADGDLRRPDGTLYRRPTWTKAWSDLTKAAGLPALEERIQSAVRTARGPDQVAPKDGMPIPDIGLAEAFSVGLGIIDNLGNLPEPAAVLSVGGRAEADLLSCRLHCRLDLVVDLGTKSLRGRPPKGADGPRLGRRLAYELHLFEEDAPTAASLRHDLRVLALSLAKPTDLQIPEDEAVVERIDVRHLRTGRVERIRPLAGEGAELLEGLARAAQIGIQSGAYIPRMVCGWQACGDCEYRPACFAGSGVMQALNPPLVGQIQANQKQHEDLREIVKTRAGGERSVRVCRDFARWLANTPGMTPQGALWILDALEPQGL